MKAKSHAYPAVLLTISLAMLLVPSLAAAADECQSWEDCPACNACVTMNDGHKECRGMGLYDCMQNADCGEGKFCYPYREAQPQCGGFCDAPSDAAPPQPNNGGGDGDGWGCASGSRSPSGTGVLLFIGLLALFLQKRRAKES